MWIETHRLCVDSDRPAEGKPLGNVAVVEVVAHGDFGGLPRHRERSRRPRSSTRRMAGYWPYGGADATATARRATAEIRALTSAIRGNRPQRSHRAGRRRLARYRSLSRESPEKPCFAPLF